MWTVFEIFELRDLVGSNGAEMYKGVPMSSFIT